MAINIRQRFALEVIVLKSVQDALWVGRYVAKKWMLPSDFYIWTWDMKKEAADYREYSKSNGVSKTSRNRSGYVVWITLVVGRG